MISDQNHVLDSLNQESSAYIIFKKLEDLVERIEKLTDSTRKKLHPICKECMTTCENNQKKEQRPEFFNEIDFKIDIIHARVIDIEDIINRVDI